MEKWHLSIGTHDACLRGRQHIYQDSLPLPHDGDNGRRRCLNDGSFVAPRNFEKKAFLSPAASDELTVRGNFFSQGNQMHILQYMYLTVRATSTVTWIKSICRCTCSIIWL